MAVLALLWAGVVLGQPVNAALEADAADLSQRLRCLVCQNQSIAESNAPLAVDLRAQVREQLTAGQTRQQVIDYMVARYGDFVLYQPPFKATTLLLWIGPGLLFFAAVAWLILTIRRRNVISQPELSTDDRARAQALLAQRSLDPNKEILP